MSYTFSIKRDDLETFLEIKVAKEIMINDIVVYYHVKESFERVLQLIMGVIDSNRDKKKEQQEESSSDQQDSDKQEENSSE